MPENKSPFLTCSEKMSLPPQLLIAIAVAAVDITFVIAAVAIDAVVLVLHLKMPIMMI